MPSSPLHRTGRTGRTGLLVVTVVLVHLVGRGAGSLRFLRTPDTIYLEGLPFSQAIDLEIGAQGAWRVAIDAGHEGQAPAPIFRHEGHGPIAVWPFTFEWAQYAAILVTVTLDDLEQGLQFVEAKRFEVKFLEPVSYLMGAPALGQSLVELDTHDETVGELLDWAVHEFSSSRRLSYDRIVQALLLSTFPVPQQCSRGGGVAEPEARAGAEEGECSWAEAVSQRRASADGAGPADFVNVYVTVEALVNDGKRDERMYLMLAVQRHVGNGANFRPGLIHAQRVPRARWGGVRPLAELVSEGRCPAAAEPQIDADLAPWEATGGVISEEIVRDLAAAASWNRYCNRVFVVNNSLWVEFAKQDQAHEATANGQKWYTMALIETLASVLARARVPDVELCVAEEGPQVRCCVA